MEGYISPNVYVNSTLIYNKNKCFNIFSIDMNCVSPNVYVNSTLIYNKNKCSNIFSIDMNC